MTKQDPVEFVFLRRRAQQLYQEGLTACAARLLRAVLEGHSKFTGADVIEDYGLNSSANVKRLRDALCKKEVISFDEDSRPYVIDPLFEYWVRTYYFKLQ